MRQVLLRACETSFDQSSASTSRTHQHNNHSFKVKSANTQGFYRERHTKHKE